MTSAEPVSAEIAALLETCAGVARCWPEQDEGPYRGGDQPRRRDVTEGRDGLKLALGIRLSGYQGEADVEIWQCDAAGRYSGYPPPDSSIVVTAATAPRTEYLPSETFLRGRQAVDDAGRVEFRTIYPGWYPGRTVHIHVMVHTGTRRYTSQLYFPEETTDEVFMRMPYRDRPDRDTTNATDEIFPTGGDPAVLELVSAEDGGLLGGACLLVPAHEDVG